MFNKCVGDPERVTIVDNYVLEICDGYGMIVDTTTCKMELNQLKKNALGGILLLTTKRVPFLKTPKGKAVDDSHQMRWMNQSTINATAERMSFNGQKLNTKVDYLRTFSQINIDNCVAVNNGKFGLAAAGFYG